MRLLLLGATGGTGLALTSLALERGHNVIALVRSPDKLKVRHDKLQVVVGDPRNAEHLAHSLRGQDAVLSALGAATRDPTTLCGDAARSTIKAMGETGVRRLLVVSSALLFPDVAFPGALFRFIFRNVLRDALAMESLVEASDLDWTVVRPPRLTNGRATMRYRIAAAHTPPASSISRADLARCMLDAVEERVHLKEVIGVSR